MIANYNIHVRLEAVDLEGHIIQTAQASRKLSGEVGQNAVAVFSEQARRAADIAQKKGWEELPKDLPPPLSCVDCGAALMVSLLRCESCAVARASGHEDRRMGPPELD